MHDDIQIPNEPRLIQMIDGTFAFSAGQRRALKSLLALFAVLFLTAFTPHNTPHNPSFLKKNNLVAANKYTNQLLSIGGSTSVWVDNETQYTYTFNSTRTPITWTITGGTIISGQGTKNLTVTWSSTNGSLTAASAYTLSGCKTIDPAPYQCCWTPSAGQSCSSPSNPCNGALAAAPTVESSGKQTTTTQEDGSANTAMVPDKCCETVDIPPYQDCTYVRHYGTLSIAPLSCPSISPPTPESTEYTVIYGQSATLNATPGSGASNVRWFDQPSDGTMVYEGTSFPTPSVNEGQVTYYAASYNPDQPSSICTDYYSTRVPVTVRGTCPAIGAPTYSVSNTEVIYGKSVTIQAQTGTNSTSVQWYKEAIGGSPIAEGTSYTTPYYSPTETYYIEGYGTYGTVTCVSNRTPVIIMRPSKLTIQTERIRVPDITNPSQVNSLTPGQKDETVTYLDGLGRVIQHVQIATTPSGKDLIMPVEFDAHGRTAKQYLPYTTASTQGLFQPDYTTAQIDFYNAAGDKVANDINPFSQVVYEASPRGLLLEQGFPGADHQPGTNHTQRFAYTYNDAGEVRRFNTDGTSTTFFPANTLSKTISTDSDGKVAVTFTDGRGRTLLKKQQLEENISGMFVGYLETYYVYNDLDQLIFILTPKGVATLHGNGWDFTTSIKSELSYQFVYDDKGRVIEMKVPGQGWTYFVYDNLDRIVLVQDPNLTAVNKWMYFKYDRKHRIVSNGLYQSTMQRDYLQLLLNNLYKPGNATYPEHAWYESVGTAFHGYTNNTFPKANADNTALEVLNVNYYDTYDFNADGTNDYNYAPQGLPGEGTASAFTQNLPTGHKKLVLGTTTWLTTYVFYDADHRPIQMRKNNLLNTDISSAPNVTTTVYDFEGKVLYVKNNHNAGSDRVTTVVNRMEYDDEGRLIRVFQNNNGTTDQLIVAYEYNELGQLIDKKLHNTSGSNFMQSVDYRYTIAGQLRSINNATLTADDKNDDSDDLFGMEFLYNQLDAGLGNTALYNGSLSAIQYKGPGSAAGSADQHSYKFQYTKAGQLKSATSQMHGSTAWNKEVNAFNETLTYDHNGNILSLNRNDRLHQLIMENGVPTVEHSNAEIDHLTYTYNAATGDQLIKVTDASARTEGFNNGTSGTGDDYQYDAHGNITGDQNKGISTITYNVFGKPAIIEFFDHRKIEYTYDATGEKLSMKTYAADNTLQTTTDYIDGFVYENGALAFFGLPEGRVVKNGSALEYQYAIGDHQGSTRVVFTSVTPAASAPVATFDGDAGDGSGQYTFDPSFVVSNVSANHTSSGSKVIRMNQTYKIGPSQSVHVYPGDKIDMEVWEYHEGTAGFGTSTTGITALITSVAGAFGGTNGAPGESGLIYDGVNSAILNFGKGANQGDAQPAAYLNYILFSKDYNVLDAGWQLAPATTFTKQKISFATKEIKEEGYIFVWLSYDNESNNWVFFDDLKVTHTKSNVIQYNEYYPYGLQTSNSWTRKNLTGNKYLYNQASEFNETTESYEMFFRGYDPAIGRMLQIDPYATQFASHSVYNYSFNNPIMFSDPSGGVPKPIFTTPDEADAYVEYLTWRREGFDLNGILLGDVSGGGNGNYWRSGMGSGNHWSDQYRSIEGNLGMMSPSLFRDFYGLNDEYGRTNYKRAGELANQLASTGGAGTVRYSVGVNGLGDGNGNIIPGTEVYVLYEDAQQGEPNPWKTTKAAMGTAVITSAVDGPIPAGEVVGAAIIIGAFVWDLVRPAEQGNPNYPGPWTTTKPDPTNAFYGPRGNTSYEPPDPEGLPPGTGIGVGGAIGGLKVLQDYLERREALKQVRMQQDATKYVTPRLGPR